MKVENIKNNRVYAAIFIVLGLILHSVPLAGTYGAFTVSVSIEGNSVSTGVWEPTPITSGVVLNEFLPNPDADLGDDTSDKPLGEWVELYNNNDIEINLSGWYIQDIANNRVNINESEAVQRLVPETVIIPAHGFLVVYLNQAMLNNAGDTFALYNASDELVDTTTYGNAPVNKSFARIPDGIGDWVDPIPTPGEPNRSDEIIVPMINEMPLTTETEVENQGDQEEVKTELVSKVDTTDKTESLGGEGVDEEKEEITAELGGEDNETHEKETSEESKDVENEEEMDESLAENEDIETEEGKEGGEIVQEESEEVIKKEDVAEVDVEETQIVETEQEEVPPPSEPADVSEPAPEPVPAVSEE